MADLKREHPYAPFLARVSKPSRYLGGEHGEVVKDLAAVDCSLCLAFPDVYDVGMSHLGFKILYSVVNAHPRLSAERAYAPWVDLERELREHGEWLRSLETWRPLKDFDVVGFSLQFELAFSNILLMLETGGIALRSEDRDEDAPLIIAGGPNATHPEPLSAFIDAFVIGDGEEKTLEIMLAWSDLKKSGMPRRERLVQLAKLGGVYVPSLYAVERDEDNQLLCVSRPLADGLPLPVQRAFVSDLNRYPFPADGPVANTETVFDRVSVEIARGCTEGCRFCQAGMIYRPVRERDPDQIVEAIAGAVRDGGYDEASLTSLSTADYSAISPLVRGVMAKLEKERVSLSVSSLRAYGLSEELLDEIQKVRATGLTFAPEAGSQRMRDVVNKNITEEQLMETAQRVFSRGWSKMKLYFMIGLPTEEEEDVRGIVQTGERARQVGRKLQKGRGPDVTVSVSTFVPKPHTPFQWCAMDARELVKEKQAALRDESKAARVKLRMHDSEGSWLEGVFARGDRSLCDVIERAYRSGARFDCWEEQLRLDVWVEAMEHFGIDTARFLGTLPVTGKLPWDHIDVGLEPGFLAKEYKKALRNRLSPPCGKAVGHHVHHTNVADHDADPKKLVCYNCGVACDLTAMRTERRDFLVKLGALTRRPEARSETEGASAAAVLPKQRRPTAKFDQGRPMRVRIAYSKLGRAAYRSHLDLVRLLPRVFRRLDLPMFYSQGFHPKPEMTFGPALPLGIASLAEYVDVKLAAQAGLSEAEICARLTDSSLEDITFQAAAVLGENDASISKVLSRADYAVGLPAATLAELNLSSEAALLDHLAAKFGEPLSVVRDFKGIKRTIKVHDYLVEVSADGAHEALARAGLVGERGAFRFQVKVGGQGGVRPLEVLEALFGASPEGARLVRCFMGSGALSPLSLEQLRAARAADRQGGAEAARASSTDSQYASPG